MNRYLLYFLIVVSSVLSLCGCKGNDTLVEDDARAAQADDVRDSDTAQELTANTDAQHADDVDDADENANNDAAASTPERTSRGPRKIQRPTSAKTRADADKDAPQPSHAPSKAQRAAPTAKTPTKDGSAPSSKTKDTPRTDSEPDNEEEHARHFSFDGSDEELEMILGLRDIPPFRIDDLLTIDDLRDGLGPHTPTTIGQLQGQTPTPFYNNLWFQSKEEGRLGLVLEYWHFQTPKAAQIHYGMLEKSAISERMPVGIGSEAYYMELNDTITLVALEVKNNAVTSITCDIKNCYVPQLMRWTTLIHERATP